MAPMAPMSAGEEAKMGEREFRTRSKRVARARVGTRAGNPGEMPTRADVAPARPGRVTRATAIIAAAWSLGFAAVSAGQIAAGPGEDSRYAAYATGLTIMIVTVLLLKLIGAVLALAAITPGRLGLPVPVVALGLWGASGLLTLYASGALVQAAGTTAGVLEPSDAWTAAGGVTGRSVLYALLAVAGAAVFGALTIEFHRRHRLRWTVAAVGFAGAVVLLAAILAIVPAILASRGLLPT
jgi:hypothetical protein